MLYERLDCFTDEKFAYSKCDLKRISRNYVKINLNITLKKPVKDVWIHGIFFYKYNLFQKFPIDLWGNLCLWLDGKSKSYLLDWTTRPLLKYSNLNHTCPYTGTIHVKADNISIGQLLAFENFLPSGRFRMDINLTEGYGKSVFFTSRTFFSVSDHRIEQF